METFEFCQFCDKPLSKVLQRRHAKWCSRKCYATYNRNKYHEVNPPSLLATATVGAISEYRVVIDLLKKHYEVFRAVSPACSCDLAILKNGGLLRIEVKTGYRGVTGKIVRASGLIRADILAIVLPDTILYEPSLPS